MLNPKLTKILSSCLISLLVAAPAIAQELETKTSESNVAQATENKAKRPTPDLFLSQSGGEKLMTEASTAIDNQQYDVAADKLQKARQVFNQLSNFYLQLFNNFSGIDNRVAQAQRSKALTTGQQRDEATYQLALVHRAEEKTELSIPLLVQVVNSQNPTTELGKKAYQQLYEIGFVDEPFTGIQRKPNSQTEPKK